MKVRKSWLRDVKTIFDLGLDLNTLHIDHPDYWKRDDMADAKNCRASMREPVVSEQYRRFFGWHMHDAWVLGIERDEKELRIRLHDLNVDFFLRHLFSMYGVRRTMYHKELSEIWPAELILIKPRWVRGVVSDQKGRFRWADYRKTAWDGARPRTEYLGDWTFRDETGMQYVADLASDQIGFLLVECEDAKAWDGRTDALASTFSSEMARLWELAYERYGYPGECDWFSRVPSLLPELLEQHGFDRDTLVPPTLRDSVVLANP